MNNKNVQSGFEDLDPESLDKKFSLRIEFYSSIGGKSKKYTGHIDTILNYGVSLKTKETCAKGHNITFEIYKEKRKLFDGTGKIESISERKGDDYLVEVVCTFNQFSEQDKKLLQKEAELNQGGINDLMDDLN